MQSVYAFFLNNGTASVQHKTTAGWQIEPLNGEDQNSCNNAAELEGLLSKLDQRLNLSGQLSGVDLHIFCQTAMVDCLSGIDRNLAALQCKKYQIYVNDDFADNTPEQGFIAAGNGLLDVENYVAKQKAEAEKLLEDSRRRAEKIQAEIAAATKQQKQNEQEKQQLINEINALKARMERVSTPPMTQLATFLPIIYKNFWLEVSPSDLALLAGTFELPTLPIQSGGVMEPTRHTIERKKKAFLALSDDERKSLMAFCRNELPKQLTVRPEMQTLVENYF